MNIAAERQDRRNKEITAPKLRVVTDGGDQIGILSLEEALAKAEEAALDLVEISPNSDPPVAKIMDYGKYLFQRNKSQQAAKKKQKQIQVKEVKFRPGTEEGDYKTKLRKLENFLDDGDKVKVTLRFRGREMAHPELGRELLDRVRIDLAPLSSVEQQPEMEGRQMIMVLAPKK